jgi:MFS family permease
MTIASLILENKWIFELLYAFVICAICMILVFKTDKFYSLSLHQGIRYFRNAFFFYGIAFIGRYLFSLLSDLSFSYIFVAQIFFEFFLVMAGFFLFYSLVWRKFESEKAHYLTSLINSRIILFELFALIIAVIDSVWQTYYLMFFSQIIIFFCASIIAYSNYIRKDRKKHKFLKFYFVAMLLEFAAWVLNYLLAACFHWRHLVLVDIGILNAIFFLLFLCGVIKITKNENKL